MATLVGSYLDRKRSLTILDIGAMEQRTPTPQEPMSYRPLFDAPRWMYRGVDVVAGPNVDIMLTSPYDFPIANDAADVIVSGQAFEHIEFFWLTWLEMARVLAPGGYIFLIAPSRGREHRYPVDCWRFYRDGFAALGKYAGLEVLETSTDFANPKLPATGWGDTVGAFRKPADWRGPIR